MGRTMVVGDIHGMFTALSQVLVRSRFQPSEDTLVILGDVVDIGEDTRNCIELLSRLQKKVLVLGNHDVLARSWMRTGFENPEWVYSFGGYQTMESYDFDWEGIPESHIQFLNSGVGHCVDYRGYLYVHGGFDPNNPESLKDLRVVTWNRSIVEYARCRDIPFFTKVFIGHTPSQVIMDDQSWNIPIRRRNLRAVDTGCFGGGKLTIMDAETDQYWQSEPYVPPGDDR